MSDEIQALVKTVLIVEDDESIGEVFTIAIGEETAYNPIVVADALLALEVVKERKPDLLVLDFRLPQMTGIELYDQIHSVQSQSTFPTIITSASNIENEIGNRNVRVLLKPFEIDELLTMIKELLP